MVSLEPEPGLTCRFLDQHGNPRLRLKVYDNDAMEDLAVAEVFGDRVSASSTKGWTGHVLGACGIVEAVIAGICMEEGFVAGCLGVETLDPMFRSRIAVDNAARPVRRVVSNSFGFGGVNSSLVLELA